MTPTFLPIARVRRETHDVVTFDLAPPEADGRFRFTPGQFNMLYAFGVGEVPISISGDAENGGRITHTLRAVGPVTRAMAGLKRGDLLGLRGPFGTAWPVDSARGRDVLVIAGGIGLAPLRPVIYHLLAHREDFGEVALLYGARSPKELLYRRELDAWRRRPGWQQRVSVDHAERDWEGDVGVVTKLLTKVRFDPWETVALICGPEVMIRFSVFALRDLGVDAARVFVSMERNMKCAIGHCGHCQYGPKFVCKDGPVFRFDGIEHLFMAREI
jgi:NAD(P)H-flavin reductase